MKSFIKLFFYASFFSLILFSCEYENSGVYEQEVNKDATAPEILIVDLDLKEDTVCLPSSEVYFKFQSNDQKIKWVRFYVDEIFMQQIESDNGVYILSSIRPNTGYHKLRIEIFTGSGTGSIADIIGAEGFLFSSKEWVIEINETNVISTISDGFLKLKWGRLNSSNSTQYFIYKGGQEIGRTFNTEFVDKSYIGEETTINIYVNSNNGLTLYLIANLKKNLPTIKYLVDGNYSYVSWSKSLYFNAVDTIIVFSSKNNSNEKTIVKKITDINETRCLLTGAFGDKINYWIRFVPKNNNPNYHYDHLNDYNNYKFETSIIECPIGIPSPKFNSFNRISNDEFIYWWDNLRDGISYQDSIYRYSVSQNKILERFSYKTSIPYYSGKQFSYLSVSPNGNFINALIDNRTNVFLSSGYNLCNFSKKNTPNFSSTIYYYKMPISDIGTGVIIQGYTSQIYLYDFVNDKILAQYESGSNAIDSYKISSNGNHIALHNGNLILYQYNNNNLEKKWVDSPLWSVKFFDFSPIDPNILVYWKNNLFYIKQCSDLQIMSCFNLPAESILDVDFYNKKILSFSLGHLYVNSLVDGTQLNDIPINFIPYPNLNSCYIQNNFIFYSNGSKYHIK